jgi:hypothetical protein
MRTKDIISNEINETQAKIEALGEDIQKLEASLEAAKKSNIELVVRNAGSERKPKSLTTQRETIRGIELDIEQTRAAVTILAGQLQEFEREKELSGISESHFVPYQKNLESFVAAVADVREEFNKMLESGNALRSRIKKCEEIGNPLGRLSSLLSVLEYDEKSLDLIGFMWPAELKFLHEFLERENTLRNLLGDITTFTKLLEFTDSQGPVLSMLQRDLNQKQRQEREVAKGPHQEESRGPRMFVELDGVQVETRKPPQAFQRLTPRQPTQQARPA